MPGIEELIRQSLRQRAGDVEPTPALWREVQRRTSRRRWMPSWQWVATSAAVVVTAVAALIVLPNLSGLPIDVPVISDSSGEDAADTDTDAAADDDSGMTMLEDMEEDAQTEAGPGRSDGDEAADGDDDAARAQQSLVSVVGRELVLHHPDGDRVLTTLPQEGESSFVSAAVRPGSGVDDLTVVTSTTAEGMFDLRWLRAVNGEVVEPLTVFEGEHGVSPAATHVGGPSWSPDGASVLWIEEVAGDVTLRTVGWSQGPGTGRRQEDEAAFSLDLEPSSFGIDSVVPDAGVPDAGVPDALGQTRESFVLLLAPETAARPTHEVRVERQADGGLALADDAVREIDAS